MNTTEEKWASNDRETKLIGTVIHSRDKTYVEGITDYKSALKEAVERMEVWEESSGYRTGYAHALRDVLSVIDTVEPKQQKP